MVATTRNTVLLLGVFLSGCGGRALDEDSETPSALGSGSTFYGINGHINWDGIYHDVSWERQLGALNDLGMTLYRNDISNAGGADKLADLARNYAAPRGIEVVPVLVIHPESVWNEDDAQKVGLDLGIAAATRLKGLVRYYECGNEFENNHVTGDGNWNDQYDVSIFKRGRGLLRGMIAGIKRVDPSAKVMPAPVSWLHFALYEMWWNGTAPDGTRGLPIRWDITSWHWYSDMRDITHACGGSGCYNVLERLQNTYHLPIWITELGVRPGYGDDDAKAAYLWDTLQQLHDNAARYDIQNVTLYQLYDDLSSGGDGNYGIVYDDGASQKHAYWTIKSFIANHRR